MRYLNGHDARMRLHGSYCRFEGQPVFVHINGDTTQATLYDLRTEQILTTIDANDERLDIESLPLGYVDTGQLICGFASRLPARQQKQGVSGDNTRITWERWHPHNRSRDAISSIPMGRMLSLFTNTYLSFDEVRKNVEAGKKESQPFHRKVALVTSKEQKSRICAIRYAGQTMGFIFKNRQKALIVDSFSDPVFRILLGKLGIEHEILPQQSVGPEETDL